VANATGIVKKGKVGVTDRFRKRSCETLAAETRFYTHAFIGIDSTGYYCKGDDTQSWLFAGVVRGNEGNPLLPAGTANDGTIDLDIEMPTHLEVDLTSVAVTDIGKPVYATFDQTVSLSTSDTTYGNVVGHVADTVAANIALIELAYDGVAAHRRLMTAKRLAATGAQTLSRLDMGKTIFCANTATLTVTLPAIADIPQGWGFTFVKDHASDANAITLQANASENIDGANTYTAIDAAWDCATLVSNGTRWVITSRDIA
jgi:hypothetical protein